jgi:dipeptidyl aminopeptidase/acylaminoacyl peptidase
LGSVSPTRRFWLDATVSSAGGIAFTISEPSKPVELFFMTATTSKLVQLTDYNSKVSKMTLGKTETTRWENDNLKHCGIVTYPTNYEKGKKHPLVLIIHGGPSAASVEMFSRFPQILANEGYFVFEPNYRGSDNLCAEYKLAIVEDAGAGPGHDVMAALEKIKATGMIANDKIRLSS